MPRVTGARAERVSGCAGHEAGLIGVFDVAIEPVGGLHVYEQQVLCERGEDGDEGVIGVNGVDGRFIFFIAAMRSDIVLFAACFRIASNVGRDERRLAVSVDIHTAAAAARRAVFDLAAGHVEYSAPNIHTATVFICMAVLNGTARHIEFAAVDAHTAAAGYRRTANDVAAGHIERASHIHAAGIRIIIIRPRTSYLSRNNAPALHGKSRTKIHSDTTRTRASRQSPKAVDHAAIDGFSVDLMRYVGLAVSQRQMAVHIAGSHIDLKPLAFSRS